MRVIYIADPEILSIPIVECDEPLIDLKNQTTILFGPPPENEFTASCYTKMRQTVYSKLCKAQLALPAGWRFRVYEGFRSLAVQKMLFDEEFNRVKQRYPDQSQDALFRETTRLISPVIHLDGTQNIPPHNTGAAVDVEVINEDGGLVDMGMAIHTWTQVDPDLCLTDCPGLDQRSRDNRLILLDVLQTQGFVNYPTEWWHFSYGDRYWAYHQQQTHACYGSAEKFL